MRPPKARSRRFASRSRSNVCAICSDAFLRSTGARPKVYLAALGPEAKHRRRVQFMREWLEVGGFEAVYDGEARDGRRRRCTA